MGPMGPLADWEMKRRRGLKDTDPMRLRIDPFVPAQMRRHPATGGAMPGCGLSGFGYDVTLGYRFRRLLTDKQLPAGAPRVLDVSDDPAEVAKSYGPTFTADDRGIEIEPHGCVLARTAERFWIPDDVIAFVCCKSTHARAFLNLNTTPLEPGWRGRVTIEIANLSGRTVRVVPGWGIGQVVFFAGSGPCEVPYPAASGSCYQDDDEIALPRVHRAAG